MLLIGATGAGKSGIISAVMGLVSISGGRMDFVGHDLGAMPCGRARSVEESPQSR